jgi:cell division protein FtsI (penicillin-binding protein 3)
VNKRYVSLFAGFGPVSDPRFVTVVSIDDPRGKFHYGGDVAAPVFSSLMQDLMRLYNIRPDGLEESQITSVAVKENKV